jgi:hypothetical protein
MYGRSLNYQTNVRPAVMTRALSRVQDGEERGINLIAEGS